MPGRGREARDREQDIAKAKARRLVNYRAEVRRLGWVAIGMEAFLLSIPIYAFLTSPRVPVVLVSRFWNRTGVAALAIVIATCALSALRMLSAS